jgi:hypothetical protein
MYDHEMNPTDSVRKICKILFDGAVARQTISEWHNKHFERSDFMSTDFPLDRHKILDGSLTDFTKQALVVYEHDYKTNPIVEQACERINNLFGEGTVTRDFVQVIFKNLWLITFINFSTSTPTSMESSNCSIRNRSSPNGALIMAKKLVTQRRPALTTI